MRQLIYFNRKPAYYLNRAFKLTCSELNGRFTSNDYIQTLTVIHPKIEPLEQQHQIKNSILQQNKQQQNEQQTINIQQQQQQKSFVAHARRSEHQIELKEPFLKSASGLFENGISVDPNDSFVRATPSTYRIRSSFCILNRETIEFASRKSLSWDLYLS